MSEPPLPLLVFTVSAPLPSATRLPVLPNTSAPAAPNELLLLAKIVLCPLPSCTVALPAAYTATESASNVVRVPAAALRIVVAVAALSTF